MKKSKFSLKQYSLLSVAFLISKEGINEVVFTDIDPDIILQFDNDVTGIDMDNNGSIDFAFLKTSDTYIYFQSSASSGFPVVRNAIFAGPYRYENKIACPYLSVSGDFFYAPYALEAGDTIDNNLSFSNYGFQEMAWKIAFLDLGGAWHHRGYWWPIVVDHYLGVYFSDSDFNYHYGWIRCSVDSAEIITIKDYAYEIKPDVGIIAGDTIGDTTTAIIEINTLDANVYSFGKNIYLKVNGFANMKLIVSDLTGKELLIKDVQSENEVIYMNKYPAGIYLVTMTQGDKQFVKKVLIE